MTQLALFDAQPEPDSEFLFGGHPDPDGLRWYQREGVEELRRSLTTNQSSFIVVATGLGKTQMFSALARSWTDRHVLVLAHRRELVEQAARRLSAMTGRIVEIEQAEKRASPSAKIVVACIDSIRSKKRLQRFDPSRFGLIVVDECHHYVGNTYTRPLERFSSAKIVGVTATPDRADEKAMAQVFDDCAYIFDIEDGIKDGWLANIILDQVYVKEVDISHVKTSRTQGGLNLGELDEAMAKATEGVVKATLEHAPDRHGIVFLPGVRSADLAARRFNALRPDSACFISGETPPEVRARLVREFREGRYQFLCNCNIATEGFDDPTVNLIVLGRPSKSRALVAQMVGRGTRVLPGTVEDFPFKGDDDIRRELIAASKKPDTLVLDIAGNMGRHTLATPVDVLGGNFSAAEVKLAKKKLKDGKKGDIRKALQDARSELEGLARVESRVKTEIRRLSPFEILHVNQRQVNRYEARFGVQPATDAQKTALARFGVAESDLKNMSKAAASKLIGTAFARKAKGLASFKQLRVLQEHGFRQINIGFKAATRGIEVIKQRGWGRKGKVPADEIERAIKEGSGVPRKSAPAALPLLQRSERVTDNRSPPHRP